MPSALRRLAVCAALQPWEKQVRMAASISEIVAATEGAFGGGSITKAISPLRVPGSSARSSWAVLKRCSSCIFVYSRRKKTRAVGASRTRSRKAAAKRWGASYQIDGMPASNARRNARRRADEERGAKPSKVKRADSKPERAIAPMAAHAPGNTSTETPAALAAA